MRDCEGLFAGPTEVSGDGDATLELGEQWTYTCDTIAFHGLINVEVSGTSGGETVTAAGGVEFGAPLPIGGTLVASTISAEVDEVVTWTITVENLGPYPLIDVVAEARIIFDGQTGPVPYDPMTGPVEISGNGDANLDPGEIWEFSYSATIFTDSPAEVTIAAAPDGAPLTRFVSTFESAVGALDAAPPRTSPPSELPLTGSDSDAYLLPVALLALLAGIGTVAAARSRE